MSVVFHDAAFQKFLRRTVLEDLRKRGDRVEAIARANLSGAVLNPKTGLTRDYMQTVAVMGELPYVKVGSSYSKNGFSPGAFWEQNTSPFKNTTPARRSWLVSALEPAGFKRIS